MTHRNPRQWLRTAGSASFMALAAAAFVVSPSSTMARSPQASAATAYVGCPAGYHRGGVQQTEGEGGHSFTSKGVQQTEGEGGHSFTSKGVQQTAAAQADMPCVPNH